MDILKKFISFPLFLKKVNIVIISSKLYIGAQVEIKAVFIKWQIILGKPIR